MVNSLQRMIPSMFSRRLLALVGAAMLVTVIFVAQLAWLTIAEGSASRQRAEKVLQSTLYTPTVRGRIVDCKDRVLAGEHASYDVAVHYSVITGEWAYSYARKDAYRHHRYKWNDLNEPQRDKLVAEYQPPYDRQIDSLWQELCELGQIDEDQLQERRSTIIQRVQQVASHMWVVWRRIKQRESEKQVSLREVSNPIAEQEIPHPILDDITSATRVRIGQLIAQADEKSVWSQVKVTDSRRRVYPYETMNIDVDLTTFPGPLMKEQTIKVAVEGTALHTLGGLRKVRKADTTNKLFVQAEGVINLTGYRPGDLLGSWGIEKSQELRLRGTRGERLRDNVTRKTIKTIDPLPGQDVTISLDIYLQARIEALMSHDPRVGLMRRQQWHESKELPAKRLGQPLNGAAVVMDIATGEILAAVSVPGISRMLLKEKYVILSKDRINMPFLNRPVSGSYLPGSTVKPLVLSAAITDRKIGHEGTVQCNGMMNPQKPNVMRCWLYKNYYPNTHGSINGDEAIKHSCNIFFFTMGKKLRFRQLVTWYARLGLGQPTRCGLTEEVRGLLPDVKRAGESGYGIQEAMMMGIGQGPIAWTPIQACKAYGTIARSGSLVHPTFLGANAQPADHPGQDWHFDPRSTERALLGLYKAANERGATISLLSHPLVRGERIFNILDDQPELRIMAKSGTADTGVTWIDVNGDEKRNKGEVGKRGDHGWAMCLVQKPSSTKPDYVIAVVVEYGGSGSHVAGPIANQILYAMNAEGYL